MMRVNHSRIVKRLLCAESSVSWVFIGLFATSSPMCACVCRVSHTVWPLRGSRFSRAAVHLVNPSLRFFKNTASSLVHSILVQTRAETLIFIRKGCVSDLGLCYAGLIPVHPWQQCYRLSVLQAWMLCSSLIRNQHGLDKVTVHLAFCSGDCVKKTNLKIQFKYVCVCAPYRHLACNKGVLEIELLSLGSLLPLLTQAIEQKKVQVKINLCVV